MTESLIFYNIFLGVVDLLMWGYLLTTHLIERRRERIALENGRVWAATALAEAERCDYIAIPYGGVGVVFLPKTTS